MVLHYINNLYVLVVYAKIADFMLLRPILILEILMNNYKRP